MNYEKHTQGVLDLFDEKKKLFIEKNKNYSCSYIKAAEIVSLITQEKPIVLNTIDDIAKFQIITRKLDKLVRYINLAFTGDQDKVGEKLNETAADDAVYSFMLSELDAEKDIENVYNDFDFAIDDIADIGVVEKDEKGKLKVPKARFFGKKKMIS